MAVKQQEQELVSRDVPIGQEPRRKSRKGWEWISVSAADSNTANGEILDKQEEFARIVREAARAGEGATEAQRGGREKKKSWRVKEMESEFNLNVAPKKSAKGKGKRTRLSMDIADIGDSTSRKPLARAKRRRTTLGLNSTLDEAVANVEESKVQRHDDSEHEGPASQKILEESRPSRDGAPVPDSNDSRISPAPQGTPHMQLTSPISDPESAAYKSAEEGDNKSTSSVVDKEHVPNIDHDNTASSNHESNDHFSQEVTAQAVLLKKIVQEHPEHLELLRQHLLSGLTSSRYIPLINLDEPYQKVTQLLSQTILAGEGNSMLVIGPRGSGKSLLVETAIADLSRENDGIFHTVRLNGCVQTDDKLALKEIWRQLGREMAIDDDLGSSRKSNYADALTSLLALLSHYDNGHGEDNNGKSPHDASRIAAKSVIFVLDEFDLFASHPRQTLLYNLFDLAQSCPTPMAVLGLTNKVNVVDLLEKRVKSRFGQRYINLQLPRTFEAFRDICIEALSFRTPTLHLFLQSASLNELAEAWNAHISALLSESPFLTKALMEIYSTSKSVSSFFSAALLPIYSLSIDMPYLLPSSFMTLPDLSEWDLSTTPSHHTNARRKPHNHDSQLSSSRFLLQQPISTILTTLPTLSTLSLTLLIAAARLEILLTTNASYSSASTGPLSITFPILYAEYLSMIARCRLTATSISTGIRTWGKPAARAAWESLEALGLILPASAAGAAASNRGRPTERSVETGWKIDVGLEEIGTWIALDGASGVDSTGQLAKWCREL